MLCNNKQLHRGTAAKTYELLRVKQSKEEAAIIRAHAEIQGESLMRFVRAAYKQIELDKDGDSQ
jgi:uncharacterized protein (DUF1778 family)